MSARINAISSLTALALFSGRIDGTEIVPEAIGNPMNGHPWITHLLAVDFDKDGLMDTLVCDGMENRIKWIRQVKPGEFEEIALGDEVKGPAHVSLADMDGDGDDDVLVAAMGLIFPTLARIGSVVVLENEGDGNFRNRVLLDETDRVTDLRGADFDGDGDIDLIVAQFGYNEGAIRYLENLGDWNFEPRVLFELSGTIHTPVADFDGDGHLDFAALVSQEWEEVYVFYGDGKGEFEKVLVWGANNEDFGSSSMREVDLDKDGDWDLLFTNGDGFDYARPGPRPWHGIQWLENTGNRKFSFHRIGNMTGAYNPVEIDLDGDGDWDVVAVSGFNNWDDPKAASICGFINDGKMKFEKIDLARYPTHLSRWTRPTLTATGPRNC